MIFNGSNGNSLIEDITFRTGAGLGQYLIADRTRYINEGYAKVAYIIGKSDGRMQWDDPNHTNSPVAKCDLTAEQSTYNIFASTPSALQDWLTIERIDIEDESGNGINLSMFDEKDVRGVAMNELQRTSSIPTHFEVIGTDVVLTPPPNYSRTAGMRVFFKRAPSYFATTDTTKVPGFASIFHEYLSIYASHVWNVTKKKDMTLLKLLDDLEKKIGLFYAHRPKHVEVPRLTSANPKMMR